LGSRHEHRGRLTVPAEIRHRPIARGGKNRELRARRERAIRRSEGDTAEIEAHIADGRAACRERCDLVRREDATAVVRLLAVLHPRDRERCCKGEAIEELYADARILRELIVDDSLRRVDRRLLRRDVARMERTALIAKAELREKDGSRLGHRTKEDEPVV